MVVPLPIETERLSIRPFVPAEDAAVMTTVYCDPEVMRYIPGGVLAGEDAVRSHLERYEREHAERGFGFWAIVERAGGYLIGDVGFGVLELTGDVELGWTLARDRWVNGFATEAATACLAAGFAHLDVPRIVAVVDAGNEASMRVARRIGMRLEDEVLVHERLHALFAADR